MLRPLGALPPVLVTGWLLYALFELQAFQRHERVWRQALDRAKLLGLVNLGLSPFIYWYNRRGADPFFAASVMLLAVSGLLFVIHINLVLRRLAAMLPDETLRAETRQFTGLNRTLLALTLVLSVSYYAASRVESPPFVVAWWMHLLEQYRYVLAVGLVLLPLAMTMALLWKTKEVILAGVFSGE